MLNITKRNGRYIVRIKNKHIGVYNSVEEACKARDKERSTMEFSRKESFRMIDGFAERFETALLTCGLDISEVSRLSGVSRNLIWSYRFEGVMPNSYNLARLAATMKVSADWLLGLKEGG